MLKAITIEHAEIGTIRSKKDGSVAFSVETPELRPSEAAALLPLHGKAVSIKLVPQDVPPGEEVVVDTERHQKSQSQRYYAVLYVLWKANGQPGDFEAFRRRRMEALIEETKREIPDDL